MVDYPGKRGMVISRRLRFRWEAWACLGGRTWVGPRYAVTKRRAVSRATRLFLSTPARRDRRALEALNR